MSKKFVPSDETNAVVEDLVLHLMARFKNDDRLLPRENAIIVMRLVKYAMEFVRNMDDYEPRLERFEERELLADSFERQLNASPLVDARGCES